MTRIILIILALTAIGIGVVQIRQRQNLAKAEMYRLEASRLEVRRTLWEQQVKMGELSSPQKSDQRGRDWPLDLVGPAGPDTTGGRVVSKNR